MIEIQTVVPPGKPKIMIVGESPGKAELASGMPFVGGAGNTLRKLLTQAGIFMGDCILTNTTNKHIGKLFADKKMQIPTPEFSSQVERLRMEIIKYKPNIIVPLGAVPLAVITGERGIKSFRGTVMESTIVPGIKVIPTYHPQAINYEWSLYYQSLMDFRKVSHEAMSPKFPEFKRELIVAPPKTTIIDYLKTLLSSKDDLKVAIDLEHITPGAHISWFGISHKADFGLSIQFINGRNPTFSFQDEYEIWTLLSKLLSSNIPQIYHNASYDVANIWHNQHIFCNNVHFDTMLAAHTMWPEFPKDLGYLASILLNVPAWKHTGGKAYEHGEYNAADAANTRALYDVMYPMIQADENFKETLSLEMKELEPSMFMQLQGINIDEEKREELRTKYQEKMDEIESGLSLILKKEVNFSSPKQIHELLYVDLQLPVQYKRRKSVNDKQTPTTDKDALEKLFIKTQHPVLKLLLEHRRCGKILQALNVKTSPTGKVHASYNIGGTETGRWSSSKSIILDYGLGNLQNVDREVRVMYCAPPPPKKLNGKKIVIIQADYKGAEAHVVAHLINDHKIIKAFDDGGDVHKTTASFMFNVPIEEVTKEQRRIGKTLRHATNYSAGPGVLATQLKVSMSKAREYLDAFHATTPQLSLWHESIKAQLYKDRTLITPLGRKRIFMGRWDDNLFRSAFAFIPQSTVGDLLNLSMVDFYYTHKEEETGGLLLQLHDAIYVWCIEEETDIWMRRMYHSMYRPIKMPHTNLYIGIDFKVGNNWGEMEEREPTYAEA